MENGLLDDELDDIIEKPSSKVKVRIVFFCVNGL
jgi:hypothetical protein